EIDTGAQVQFQTDTLGSLRLETLGFGGDGVLAWIEERKAIIARSGADILPLDAGLHLKQRDSGPRYYGSSLIRYGPQNRGGGSLRPQLQRSRQRQHRK